MAVCKDCIHLPVCVRHAHSWEEIERLELSNADRWCPDFKNKGDVAPVVPGKWFDDGTGDHLCSNCGCYADYDEYEMDVREQKREHLSPHCPNCGAKMGLEG